MDNQIPPVSPVPPIPVVPPPLLSAKSQNWLKVLLAAIGVLVIIGLFGNLYLLAKNQKPTVEINLTPTQIAATPAADPTANWKTYTNSQYGFQMKYPSQWFSETYEKGDESVLFLNPSRQPIVEGTEPYEPITILVDTKNKSQAEFIASWQRAGFEATPWVGMNLPFNAVKYSVKKIEPAPGPDNMTIFVMPLKTNFLRTEVNDSSLIDIANQILSTFQFLN